MIKRVKKTKAIRFYVVILAMLMGTNVYSQTIDLGVKLGANFGLLRSGSDLVSDASGKTGWHVGLFVRTGNDLYFQPEINLNTFASEYVYDAQTYQPAFRQLNMPLMVGYKLINNGDANLRMSLGPDLSLNLNTFAVSSGAEYRRLAVGGVANVGVDIGRITLDARCNIGLTTTHQELEQRSRLFSLAVGFKIM